MTNKDEGFTLIELLVVIGIIVALAAVTVPLVTKFAGKGDEGALEAETQTVQTVMDRTPGPLCRPAREPPLWIPT